MIGGAVTEEVELLFFDAVFHLTSGTILLDMEVFRTVLLGAKGGDDKMASGSSGSIGDLANDPTLAFPGSERLIRKTAITDRGWDQSVQVFGGEFVGSQMRGEGFGGLVTSVLVVPLGISFKSVGTGL